MKNKDIIILTILIIFSIISFFKFFFYSIEPYQNECKNLGYNKITDLNSNRIMNSKLFKIECDGEVISGLYYLDSKCIEINKWGECSKEKLFVSKY